ncbi:MAG: class I SAM-dependent methyltransferase [Candidatus Aminicenantes bacterium]|nr:class I SAM-dependent methyltransferase [Candidatus Aminicenantes bacterium]
MVFHNSWEDTKRAEAYAKLEFPGTYYLAYRDLQKIIFEHVQGRKAIDFGCGTGRSTRFLKRIGFNTTGVDISKEMINKAKEIDPEGDYRIIGECDSNEFSCSAYDLVLSVFTFDNIPGVERRIKILKGLRDLLKREGRLIMLDATPEIYVNEWASFSTKDFPENRNAKSGEKVKIITTAIEDARPIEDIIWTDEDYKVTFKKSNFDQIKTYKPLAKENEPYKWINETSKAPWIIYVLGKKWGQAKSQEEIKIFKIILDILFLFS